MSLVPTFPTLIPGVLPPSRETWEWSLTLMRYMPLFALVQFFVSWFPMGKHSKPSPFNLPGKVAWVIMEIPTILISGYIVNTLPKEVGLAGGFNDLPGSNKLMIALYILHYLNRAVITPIFLTPSMAPIHAFVCFCAFTFNSINAINIGGWLGGYGPTDNATWAGGRIRLQVGLMLYCLGLFGNILHEDELREIRRKAMWEAEQKAKKEGKKDGEKPERVYKIPQSLLFSIILYPHYLLEWIEWAGFWIIGGTAFLPGQLFWIAVVVSMVPQAISGKKWYVEKFGKENVGGRKAVIPFLL